MFRVLSSDCEAKFLLVSMRTGCNGHLYSYLKHISDPHWWWWVVCATFFLFLSELLIHHNCPPREHWREAGHPGDRVVRGRCAWWQHEGRDMLLRRGRDQVQPQFSRRGIGAASSGVTHVADRSVKSPASPIDQWPPVQKRSFEGWLESSTFLRPVVSPSSSACNVSWNMEVLVVV